MKRGADKELMGHSGLRGTTTSRVILDLSGDPKEAVNFINICNMLATIEYYRDLIQSSLPSYAQPGN